MSVKTYKLLVPVLTFKKGEQFTYDTEWGEWTRRATGDVFGTRNSIGEGEVALLFDFLTTQRTMMEEL